jgi:hypothetical protein
VRFWSGIDPSNEAEKPTFSHVVVLLPEETARTTGTPVRSAASQGGFTSELAEGDTLEPDLTGAVVGATRECEQVTLPAEGFGVGGRKVFSQSKIFYRVAGI